MMATILKSPKAIGTTIAIIDTFAKVKALNRVIQHVQTLPENSPKQKTVMAQTGELMADLIMPTDLEVTGTETTYEMNLQKERYTNERKRIFELDDIDLFQDESH
jgi:hypothetical protein